MGRAEPTDSPRTPRESATFRGVSGAYYGFAVFRLDETLPRAAGLFAMASETLGPERWRILLIGETANFAAGVASDPAFAEAQRRGASRILLHFSPLPALRRREAAHDLWQDLRPALTAWGPGDTARHA